MNTDFSNIRGLLRFIVLALAFVVYMYAPITADAITMTPVRFELTGNPGDVVEEEILLTNEGDDAETYYVSFANFEAQGETGNPAFVPPIDGLGTWMSVGSSTMYLAPREQKAVPLRIEIPKNADPGGHFAVIFWGTSPAGAGQVSIGSQAGILVLLSVNGDVRQDAGLIEYRTRENKFWYPTLPVHMEYRFKNDGGDRVKPAGKVTIRNTFFLPTERLDANVQDGNVLPASTRKFNVKWQNYERPEDYLAPDGVFGKFWSDVGYQWRNFAVGLYSAKLDIVYGLDQARAKDTIFFFVFPWQLVVVMTIVILIVFCGGRTILRRYNKYIIERARSGMMDSPPSSPHE